MEGAEIYYGYGLVPGEMGGECRVCGRKAAQVCGGCRQAAYCSREHQSEDWAAHKGYCGPPLEVRTSSPLGRHLVATRTIAPGEVVLKEKPLVLGPKMRSLPVCLGCHKELDSKFVRCPRCTWPLCSEGCSKSPLHQGECSVMAGKGYRCEVEVGERPKREVAYCVITPLRCLLLESKKRKMLLDLQSHVEVRIETPLYTELRNNLVPFITKVLGLPFNEMTIMKVAGILDTNCFEVNSGVGGKVRGLYPRCAMFAHDCVPNTKHHFTREEELVMVATQEIPKGAVVSVTYTQSFWGTPVRREHLLGSKCFLCSCARCSDPNELGTFLGALRCSKCKEGKVVSGNPLDSESWWKCNRCGRKLSSDQVCEAHLGLQRQLQAVDKSSPASLERLVVTMMQDPNVHKNSYELLQVKYALCQLYGRIAGDLTDEQMEKWERTTEDLLSVANVVEPGYSRLRGELLYDLQSTKLHAIRQKLKSRQITKAKAQEEIKQTLKILSESVTILKTEPDLYPMVEAKVQGLKNFSHFLSK